jgi:glycosyltransferase involved in cell wall biosynthesis
MRLLVGIPALDEEPTIGSVVAGIPAHPDGVDAIEVLVVDDGSTDGTAEAARRAGADVIRHPGNLGVGAAFQTLVREALRRGVDLLVTLDGDGQFDPKDIPALLAPLQRGEAEVATASRFADPALVPDMPAVKRWGNRRVAALVSRLAGHTMRDVSCGYRAYTREALLRLTVHGSFTYTHETLLDLAAKSVPIVEVPMAVRGTRAFGTSRVAANVAVYAVRAVAILLRFYRDYHPLRLCAAVAAPVFLAGAGLLLASFLRFQETGVWLKWAALSGGAAFGVGLGVLFFGFLAGISGRIRRNQEEMLYWLRRIQPPAPPREGDGGRR